MVKYEYFGQFCFIREPKCNRFAPCIDISPTYGFVKMFGMKDEEEKGIKLEVKEKIIPLRTGDRIIVNSIDDDEEIFNHLLVRNKKCCSSIYDKYTFFPVLKNTDLNNFLAWGEAGTTVKMIRILCWGDKWVYQKFKNQWLIWE